MNNDKTYSGKCALSFNRALKPLLSVVAIAFMAVIAACSSDDDGFSAPVPGDMKETTITISAKAPSTNAVIEKESAINTLRIYAFYRGRLVGYHYSKDVLQSTKQIIMQLPSGTVDIYAIVNEDAAGALKKNNAEDFALPGPVDGSEPDLAKLGINEEDINSLTFSTLPEAELTSGNPTEKDENKKAYSAPYLPMVGKVSADLSTTASVTLGLTRSVAKLNLYFAKQGMLTDTVYMGRGLYLYNVPEYGYLMPRDTYTGSFNNVESDTGDNTDSYLNQKGGKIILRCGWTDEGKETVAGDPLETHINEILSFNNTPEHDFELSTYQHMPARPIYLFANPNAIPETESPSKVKFTSTNPGYYIKVLAHMHRKDDTGASEHKGEVYWIALPEVRANDNIEVMSIITVDGYMSITPHWLITDWTMGGGDVEFN